MKEAKEKTRNQKILAECMALYNRGYRAGAKGEKGHFFGRAHSYFEKILAIIDPPKVKPEKPAAEKEAKQ
jgi:hypothetical protein